MSLMLPFLYGMDVTSALAMLIGLVCRDKGRDPDYSLTRRLVGDTAAEFPPVKLEFQGERCAHFSDLVPGGTLTEGSFVYEIRVRKDDEELQRWTADLLAKSVARGGVDSRIA